MYAATITEAATTAAKASQPIHPGRLALAERPGAGHMRPAELVAVRGQARRCSDPSLFSFSGCGRVKTARTWPNLQMLLALTYDLLVLARDLTTVR